MFNIWIKIALVGLILAYVIGKISIQTGNGLNIRRRFDNRPLHFASIAFAIVVMLFLFIENWNNVLNMVMGTMSPESPIGITVCVCVSGLAIALIAILYGLIMRGVGRIASATKLQRIYERRWYVRHLRAESAEQEEVINEVESVVNPATTTQ